MSKCAVSATIGFMTKRDFLLLIKAHPILAALVASAWLGMTVVLAPEGLSVAVPVATGLSVGLVLMLGLLAWAPPSLTLPTH